jgi:hypothetical protein
MAQKSILGVYKLFISSLLTALALSPAVRAGGYRCNCEASAAVFHSPFYGYYRTCWRPWPGGQPPCPCYVVAEAEKAPARTGGPERTIELLPLPRPEEPEAK